jgi:type II secretory pathway component GspD/PulD (secretin)
MRNTGSGRRSLSAIALVLCLALVGQATLGAAERRVDLDLVGAELAEVFRALAELGDMNIVLDPAVRGTLTIRLNDLPVEEALRLVAYTTGVDYRVVGSTVIVVPSGAVRTGLEPLGIEKFSLTYARTTDVMGAVRLVAGGAKLESDERTNSIIACGSAEELRAIGEVLVMLDVPVQLPPEAIAAESAAAPPESVAESLEVVRLKYVPAQAVADLLAVVVPSDRMRVDSRTNTMVMIVDEPSRERAMKIISEVDVAELSDDVDVSPILSPAVSGKDSAVERPIIETEAVKIIKLAWAPVDKVRAALEVVIDLSKVGMDLRTNSLIVKASPQEIDRIEGVVALLDVPVVTAEEPAVPTAVEESIHMLKLDHASANSARDVLTMIIPPAKMQVDERTNTVVVMADEDTYARAVELARALDVGVPSAQEDVDEEVSVEAITLKHASPGPVRDGLATVVPKDDIIADERTSTLIVRGTSSQHERVRQIVALLDVPVSSGEAADKHGAEPDPSAEPTTNIRAFRLEEADPEAVREGLALVMPKASVHVDERTKSVLVVGLPDELARAEKIVDLLDQPSPDRGEIDQEKAEAAEVRVIGLVHAPAATARETVASIMQDARIAADERSNSLLVVASPSVQRRVAEVVAALDIEIPRPELATEPVAPQDSEVTRVVTLAHAQAAQVREALAPIVPVSSITVDDRTNSLVIVTAQSRMDRALEVIAKLDVEDEEPEAEKAEIVRLQYASPVKVREALAPTIPASRISVDERTGSLVIVGTAAERARALSIIEALDIEVPRPEQGTEPVAPQDPEVMRVVTLAHAQADQIREALAPIVPVSNITVDPRTNSLVIVTAQSRMDRALEVIVELDVEDGDKHVEDVEPAAPRDLEVTRVVTLAHAQAAQVREALAPIVPVSSITVDPRTNSLVIVTDQSKMERALEVIDKLDVDAAAEPTAEIEEPEAEKAEVVRLEHASPTKVREALTPIIPVSRISVDERTGSMVIVGSAAERAQALAIIEELDIEVSKHEPGTEPVAAKDPEVTHVVKLMHAPAAQVREALAPIVPVSSITVDSRTNSLVIVAVQPKMDKALEVIDKLDVEVAPVQEGHGEAEPFAAQPVVVTYRLAYASAESLRPALGLLVPSSEVQIDARTNTLLVKAIPSSQRSVAELVASLDIPVEEPEAPEPQLEVLRVFRLKYASPSEMKSLLGFVAPTAKVQADDRTGSLIVLVPADSLRELEDIIESLDLPPVVAKDEPDPVVTRVYRLNYAMPSDIEKALENFVSGTMTSDPRTSSIVVRAAQSEQAKALELIDSLDCELPQVLIEVRLEELTGDAARKLGIDWTFSGLSFGENAFGQWVSVSMDFLANLTALEESGHANLISRQHTFTVDGKTGKILIGDRIPIMTQEVQEGQAVNRIEFINAGIELSITPKVSSDGTITATVKPVISSVVGWTPQNYPQIRTRELETIVSLKSGQTAVIGGLLHSDEIEGMAKIPLLGDIPLFGELFKKRTTTMNTTELVMLITAYQVNSGQRPAVGPALEGDSFPITVEDMPGGKQ